MLATVLTSPLKSRSPYPGRADYIASPALFDYYLGHLCPPQRVALQANSSDEFHRSLAALESGPDRLFWYVWGHRTDPRFLLALRAQFTVRQEASSPAPASCSSSASPDSRGRTPPASGGTAAGKSVRTLQRRLKDRGLEYQGLLDTIRQRLATELVLRVPR